MVQRHENPKKLVENNGNTHGAARALERTLLRYDTNPSTGMYIRSISSTAYMAVAYFLVAAELIKKGETILLGCRTDSPGVFFSFWRPLHVVMRECGAGGASTYPAIDIYQMVAWEHTVA